MNVVTSFLLISNSFFIQTWKKQEWNIIEILLNYTKYCVVHLPPKFGFGFCLDFTNPKWRNPSKLSIGRKYKVSARSAVYQKYLQTIPLLYRTYLILDFELSLNEFRHLVVMAVMINLQSLLSIWQQQRLQPYVDSAKWMHRYQILTMIKHSKIKKTKFGIFLKSLYALNF